MTDLQSSNILREAGYPYDTRDVICLMKFGSHLYGTDTPESDTDYKGVFMPTYEQIITGKIPKQWSYKSGNDTSKNSKDDVDIEVYSVHYFFDLAMKGETVALDMLHAPDGWELIDSVYWQDIKYNRHLFYTKNLKAFVSYARKQAAKYGIKGSRLGAMEKVIDVMDVYQVPDETFRRLSIPGEAFTLKDIWEYLPTGEHIHKGTKKDANGIRMYQVCGKQFPETAKVTYVLLILKKAYETYGHRAHLAKKNMGIDWKAISHALRAAYVVREILAEQDFSYPFPSQVAEYLKAVKAGNRGCTTEVAPYLENLMEQLDNLAEHSSLPAKVNHKKCMDLLLHTVCQWHGV